MSEHPAAAGARVIIAMRSEQKSKAAKGAIVSRVPSAHVDLRRLDLADLASVRRAADRLKGLDRLDGLLENAGVNDTKREHRLAKDGLELLFGTNHLGHFAPTTQTMSVLERTPGSRVVVMDSRMAKSLTLNLDDLHSERYHGWTAYIRTKVATESFGHELASRSAASGSGVSAIVVHPGRGLDARTPDRPGMFEKSAAQQLFRPIRGWAGQGKDRATWSRVRAAIDPEIVNGQDGGARRNHGIPIRRELGRGSTDSAAAARLWAASEGDIGLRFELSETAVR